MLVALFLQAILFQFGGLTTLGVNTMNMALPAVYVWVLFSPLIRQGRWSPLAAFLAGAFSVGFSGLMVALELALTGRAFLTAAKLILAAHLPVMIIEGLVTCFIVSFLRKVRPEILLGGEPV
jgi:cobalt/nickel transport system permease protein